MNSTIASTDRANLLKKYLGIALAVWHLSIIWGVTGAQDKVIINGLLWWAISSKVHPSNYKKKLKENGLNDYIGAFFILLLLPASLVLMTYSISHTWLRLLPWILFSSWFLISSANISKTCWRCLCLILIITFPEGFLSDKIEPFLGIWLQRFLTQISHFILHYIGISAFRNDIQLVLPQGSVVVEYGCAGVPLLILLAQLFVLLTFGQKRSIQSLTKLIIINLSIFLTVTSFRIALMAILVDQPDKFDYWHSNQGAEWFSTLAIVAVTLSSVHSSARNE